MDASRHSSIQLLVEKIKSKTLFDLHNDPQSFLSPSAYDTAWLAMVPNIERPGEPMFGMCLDWVLENQSEEGFWSSDFDAGTSPVPGVECLPSTLACLVALKKWNVGCKAIDKGLHFLHENTEKFLTRADVNGNNSLPRWFTIMFPAMLELACAHGLPVPNFHGTICESIVSDLFQKRKQIILREELVDKDQYLPLLAYLETLPPWHHLHGDYITQNLGIDGSLFHSPSATARAYMATRNVKCLGYLRSLIQKFPNHGVPSYYPVSEEFIKLLMVNQITRLGLAEYFDNEIKGILAQTHRKYKHRSSSVESAGGFVPARLYEDSLAFWLLRKNGYNVAPSIFCWFLYDEGIQDHMRDNYEDFTTVLLNIYRATDLMFPGEPELQEARSFSRKYLEKIITDHHGDINLLPGLRKSIEHELNLPWAARLDHLEHRMWIEDTDANALWVGKCSFHRLSSNQNAELLQLAVKSYTYRQSIYRDELEEAKRWSKRTGLCDMGFGREKTTYCYFACASSNTSLLFRSSARLMVVKSAIIITVADDFYDTKGSMEELEQLTDAVLRWDGQGLTSHAKTIFKALDDLVCDIRNECLVQNIHDITSNLQDLWYETFLSWLMEAKWAKGKVKPSVDKYIENAMTSIAAHTLVLPAAYFVMSDHRLLSSPYRDVTRLVMLTTRLLNDMQSYMKEEEEGKMNLLWIYMMDNPRKKMEDSIEHVRGMLDESKRDLLRHVLTPDDMPSSCKQLHLSCFKVFHMFFDSSNRYDSDIEMLQDIEKALVSPPEIRTPKNPRSRKEKLEIIHPRCDPSIGCTYHHVKTFSVRQTPRRLSVKTSGVTSICSSLKPCFI